MAVQILFVILAIALAVGLTWLISSWGHVL
jgi:hypothetical protein